MKTATAATGPFGPPDVLGMLLVSGFSPQCGCMIEWSPIEEGKKKTLREPLIDDYVTQVLYARGD